MQRYGIKSNELFQSITGLCTKTWLGLQKVPELMRRVMGPVDFLLENEGDYSRELVSEARMLVDWKKRGWIEHSACRTGDVEFPSLPITMPVEEDQRGELMHQNFSRIM